ncbi:MAG: sulfate transporter CysZ [Nitrospira sp.]|nr:sulfate transporter CysZ [Nitrospira sp.]
MSRNSIAGAGYLLRGLTLITQAGIRQYVIIPLMINTVLFAFLIWYGANQFSHLIEWLLPDWLDWLRWLLWPLFAVTGLLILFYTFSLVANLVGAPFNGPLAEAVERHLTGQNTKQSDGFGKLARDLFPSLVSEFKKILYFLVRAVPLLILFLIPGINIVAPFLWIAFSAWMLALEYADYPMGNHGLLFPQQRLKLQEKRMMVLGFGGAALLLTLIPVVNFLVMPTAVAGATVMWVEEFGKEQEKR